MDDESLTIGTSGYSFALLNAVSGLAVAGIISLAVISVQHGPSLGKALAALLFCYLAAFLQRLVFGQRIELSRAELTIQSTFTRDVRWWPRVRRQVFPVRNVELVTIARLKSVLGSRSAPSEVGESFRANDTMAVSGGVAWPLALRRASEYQAVMMIHSKGHRTTAGLPLKPFSKQALRRLIAGLRERGIRVIIDPSLHLEHIPDEFGD